LSGSLTINNATFNVDPGDTLTISGGISGTYNGTAGDLTLSANSIIDLGEGSVVIHFADLAMGLYNLSIYNWSGNMASGGGTDQFYVDRPLTSNELEKISFYSTLNNNSFIGTGLQLSSGSFANEVVPVPEPETWATAALLLLSALWWYSRQREKGSVKNS
jgi:hypothetical protein